MKKPAVLVICLALLSCIALPLQASATAPQRAEKKSNAVSQVNINQASSEQLQTIPGVGSALAERIVSYRSEHGPFKNAAELLAIRGIGEKNLAKMRSWITVN